MLLKALAKSNGNLFAIAFKDAKRIKSDYFTRSNKEKINIVIAILEIYLIGWHHNYFVFWW